MALLFTEKLLQQLAQREKTIYQCSFEYFLPHLKAYFTYLEGNPILLEIVNELKKEKVLSNEEWLQKYNTDRMPYLPDTIKAQAAQCLILLEAFKDSSDQNGFMYYVLMSSGNLHVKKQTYFENIFSPFHSYLVEHTTEGNFNEFVLKRYKMWCEWYRREELRDKLSIEQKKVNDGEKGKREFEKILTTDAVSFLFLNGLTPISLTLGNCKPDITTDIFAMNPLATEVKVFTDKDDLGELKFGARQLGQALSTTGLSTGFLIVFNIGKAQLKIVNDQEDGGLMPIVIDVTEVPPNQLKGSIKITVSDLLKEV